MFVHNIEVLIISFFPMVDILISVQLCTMHISLYLCIYLHIITLHRYNIKLFLTSFTCCWTSLRIQLLTKTKWSPRACQHLQELQWDRLCSELMMLKHGIHKERVSSWYFHESITFLELLVWHKLNKEQFSLSWTKIQPI